MEREWSSKLERPPLKSLIDHIDHVAKVAGVDHVGLRVSQQLRAEQGAR